MQPEVRDHRHMSRANDKFPAGKSRRKQSASTTMQGTRIATLGGNLFVVRAKNTRRPNAETRSSETARVLVPKIGRALAKPGLDRKVVFSGPNVDDLYAYYAHSRDATKVVQESADGTKRVGRVVRGKFVAE